MKKICVLGSGGREHALATKCASSSLISQVYVIPGNPGMNLSEKISSKNLKPDDFGGIYNFLKEENIETVIVGPENLLESGIADFFKDKDINIIGPTKALAKLESSKAFAKDFMAKNHIPTASYFVCDSYEDSLERLTKFENPPVIKADGLHAGKGVVVSQSFEEAKETLENFFCNPSFKIKTKKVVLEERLEGSEVSIFALSDGQNYKVLGSICDHKRLYEGDKGPNTGGMGCFSASGLKETGWPSFETKKFIEEKIIKRTFDSLKSEGHEFCGFLFFGLMVNEQELEPAKVIEYNVRMGDPETQTLLPLIKSDLVPYFESLKSKSLNELPKLEYLPGQSVHVVMASRGYPGIYGEEILLGKKITIDFMSLNALKNSKLFFAGVKKDGENLVNSGGRVLGLTCVGEDLKEARSKAYQGLSYINFEGAQFRRDIGER